MTSSSRGLKGRKANENRQTRCCSSGTVSPLDSLPRELGLDPVWFTSVARPKMDSVVAHMDAARDLSWCAGIDRHTMTYVNFCHEFIYDLTYDSCIKALVKIHQAGK